MAVGDPLFRLSGASRRDPARLLEGGGKRMRPVKLRCGGAIGEERLGELIAAAYLDVRSRLSDEGWLDAAGCFFWQARLGAPLPA
ncbi:hypothetical protein ACM61V_03095 [Sphingomonas sp. TX0543]|uniref:hypothetical protein n=1 Tax=unclassified Sphingomonas TaxID=196159 RepID=UPI0010F6055D|nr:hypothetical protein [Sphingomonas sp. 3P27F8]